MTYDHSRLSQPHGNHLVNHIKNAGLVSNNTLHVVGVISNHVRYHSRYRLFREWEKCMLATPGVKLHIVETAFGDRNHEVTDSSNENHLQLRTRSEIWIKENMINLGVRHLLPRDWKYMAWVDCDVFFENPSWAIETMEQLQHYAVVQPWQTCGDMGFHGQVMQNFKSFGFQHQRRVPKQTSPAQPYEYAHSGFAWACTRAFWEATRGLIDFAILGSGDHHMAFGMVGDMAYTIHREMTLGFHEQCFQWQKRAMRITRGEVGFVNGHIKHGFHGPKKRRYYRERWEILVQHKYNPETDIMHDPQGLVQLLGQQKLEQAIRLYNRSRMEDSIEEV